MNDSIEFHGGEVTLRGPGAAKMTGDRNKNELSTTFMAFEDRLEKMMQ